jgi:hypothetical protein
LKSLLLIGAVTIPAAAFTWGGWAVTTVEDVPEYVVAGRPFPLTWSVRQHGNKLTNRLDGAVSARSGTQRVNSAAGEQGEGMYRAMVTLPTPGTWDVQINSGFMESGVSMPLRVIAANAPPPPPMAPYDRGAQLYLAKGCATCHSHQLTKNVASMRNAPDLSEPKFSSAYLTRFLTNPAIKTDWRTDIRMPNLGLKPAEITALVAFLNQDKR